MDFVAANVVIWVVALVALVWRLRPHPLWYVALVGVTLPISAIVAAASALPRLDSSGWSVSPWLGGLIAVVLLARPVLLLATLAVIDRRAQADSGAPAAALTLMLLFETGLMGCAHLIAPTTTRATARATDGRYFVIQKRQGWGEAVETVYVQQHAFSPLAYELGSLRNSGSRSLPAFAWTRDEQLLAIWNHTGPMFAYDFTTDRELVIEREAYRLPSPNYIAGTREERIAHFQSLGFSKEDFLANAVHQGDIEWSVTLLDLGASPEGNDENFTPLFSASCEGHADVVRLLVARGANPSSRNLRWSDTPLTCAASRGHPDVVRALLEAGATTDDQNSFGSSALILAAYHGHSAIVRELLAHGANRRLKNGEAKTAFEIAREAGHGEIAALLMR